MTKLPNELTNRRSYLKGLGIGAAAIGGLSAPAAASGDDTLKLTPGSFSVYGSVADEPDELDEFGFPDDPFLAGLNPIEDKPLFDSSDIRITPNRNTLHHELQVFAGLLMECKPKPYTLVRIDDDGLFEARGQTVNFTARSMEEIAGRVKELPPELFGEASPTLFEALPLLAGEKWRAVATERIKVDLSDGPDFDYEWAATRVDLYSRGGERPEHTLSLIYVLWADTQYIEEPEPQEKAEEYAKDLIEAGPLNMGGQ